MNRIFKIFAISSLIIILLLVIGVGFLLYGLYQFFIPLGGSQNITVTIEKGQGVKEIAAVLEKQNLIRNSFWFETYVWLEGSQNKLQAGEYSLNPGLNVSEIVRRISGGQIVENDIWVTIPEGFTLKQIKSRLLENNLASADGLSSKIIGEFTADYEFLSDAPKTAGLEGFLFPDTYKYKKDVGEEAIIVKMLDNFGEKLTQNLQQDIKARGLKIYDAIIMASIIEKEGKTAADKKIISGIFWKRFGDKYPLESDATLSYIFDDKVDRHTIEQTKVDSPYNTYKYVGLPPGPINNPGLDSIEAAIYPETSPYYFFLTKSDTGEAVFAKTLQEHNQNKAEYLK